MTKVDSTYSAPQLGDEVECIDVFGGCEFFGTIDYFVLDGYIAYIQSNRGLLSWSTESLRLKK